eukprot:6216285-Pyramimonas_sp.AAC.2
MFSLGRSRKSPMILLGRSAGSRQCFCWDAARAAALRASRAADLHISRAAEPRARCQWHLRIEASQGGALASNITPPTRLQAIVSDLCLHATLDSAFQRSPSCSLDLGRTCERR